VDWNEQTINIVAFATIFIIIVVAVSLAGKAFTKFANFAALGLLNKLLGGIFGALKIGLILSILLLVFSKMNTTLTFLKDKNIEESMLYKPVKSIAPLLFPSLIIDIESGVTS
jgi:membrane protein required for colicin V production